jgi:hypothetical protein
MSLADLGEAINLTENIQWGEDMFTGTPYFMVDM